MRFRYWFMGLGSLWVLMALFFTDPDKGVATGMLLLGLVTPLLAVVFAHLSRRGLFDYINLQEYAEKGKETSIGAAIVFLGACIVLNGLLGIFNRARAENLPANALIYAPLLKVEQVRYWPTHTHPELLASLAEQESCVYLKSPKCWSPSARLNTSKEEGAGIPQITRAYRADGTVRFDSLAQMRKTYPDLHEWSWENVYQRPDLQLRALVLLVKENYNRFPTTAGLARFAFADAGYNGGPAGVQNERRACGLLEGCNPQEWFNHVERHCLKSRAALYGQRSACDINREHVRNVLLVRSAKYRQIMS